MYKTLLGFAVGLSLVATTAWALPIVSTQLGGTGTSTIPSYGQVLVGAPSGGYFTTMATSSLGLTSTGASTTLYADTGYWSAQNTFADFIATKSTTTNATSTTFAVSSSLCINGDCKNAWPTTSTGASTTLLADSSAFTGKNTMTNLVVTSATNTNATSTHLHVSGTTKLIGRVGIATSTPATELDVYGTTTTRYLTVNDGGLTGTTTVAIGNPKIGRLCLWNGGSFTIMGFPYNSITPSYSTSTSCY